MNYSSIINIASSVNEISLFFLWFFCTLCMISFFLLYAWNTVTFFISGVVSMIFAVLLLTGTQLIAVVFFHLIFASVVLFSDKGILSLNKELDEGEV